MPKVIFVILVFNVIASLAFFGLHTVRQHLKSQPSVWAVTTGTGDTAYTNVIDSNRTFWEETLLLLMFISANLVAGIGLMVLQRYH